MDNRGNLALRAARVKGRKGPVRRRSRGTGLAEREMDQRCGRAAAAAHLLADVEAVLLHGARELEALLVAPFDQDVVAAQRRGNTVRSTAEHTNDTQRRQRAPHGTTRLAPTKRVTHQAPSESSISRRDSFTPVLEL